jgi:cardiolipin synthase
MDVWSFVQGLSWTTVLVLVVAGYTLSVAIFLILENRTPQSTFAWLFLLILVPIGGLIIYLMFGRRRHAFSREQKMTPIFAGTALAERASRVIAEQPAKLAAIGEKYDEYRRLASVLWATAQSPLTLRNQVEILQDAREKYPRLLADMRAATHSIHLLYYEWASDPFTNDLAELLAGKFKEGVQVRILYDPVGSFFMLSRRYIRRVRQAGIRMYPFSPLYLLHTLSYRNHRKIAVIDGRIGYSGGLNITEKHLTGPEGFTGWRDTHARVTGEAVPILRRCSPRCGTTRPERIYSIGRTSPSRTVPRTACLSRW